MWQDQKFTDKRVVLAETQGFMTGFFKEIRDGSVCILMTPPAGTEFDIERPPVLWVDDGEKLDLSIARSMQHLAERHDLYEVLHFSSETESVMARIWHGNPAEGLGFIGSMLNGKTLNFQSYMSNYEVIRCQIELDADSLFRQVLGIS